MRKYLERNEEGFTLIELLVVVIIIGILAAIAIPVFLNQRAAARDSSVKSDIDSLTKNLEGLYQVYNRYPDAAAMDASNLVRVSPGNVIYLGFFDSTDTLTDDETVAVGYVIAGYNSDSNRCFWYDSADGGHYPTGIPADASGPCTDDPTGMLRFPADLATVNDMSINEILSGNTVS